MKIIKNIIDLVYYLRIGVQEGAYHLFSKSMIAVGSANLGTLLNGFFSPFGANLWVVYFVEPIWLVPESSRKSTHPELHDSSRQITPPFRFVRDWEWMRIAIIKVGVERFKSFHAAIGYQTTLKSAKRKRKVTQPDWNKDHWMPMSFQLCGRR